MTGPTSRTALGIDTEHAHASVKQDEERIKEKIKETVGFGVHYGEPFFPNSESLIQMFGSSRLLKRFSPFTQIGPKLTLPPEVAGSNDPPDFYHSQFKNDDSRCNTEGSFLEKTIQFPNSFYFRQFL